MSASNVLIYGETTLGVVKPISCSDDGNLVVSNSTAVSHLVNNTYFDGDLTTGDILDTIDLGTRNTIQFGGRTNTSTFSFLMEYSVDEVNWNTDGYVPEITNVNGDFLFNITRTDICMEYIRLRCISSGVNVFIQFTAIKQG